MNARRWPMSVQIALLILAILGVFAIVGAFDMKAEETTAAITHEAMQRLAAARELERGLRNCPASGPGMTDIVVMVVRYESDIAPAVERCMRIAERSYLTRPAR